MSKKSNKSKPNPKPSRSSDALASIEKSPYFALFAFIAIGIVLLVIFGSFIFSDKMLRGSDTINAGVFFRSFYVDYVHQHGEVPKWNPYIFGGMPYIEAFHGDIFYPLSVLKFFGSIYWMLGFNLVLHIFLAGIFMYLTARQFGLSKIPSLMSGVCYMFAPYLVSLIAPGHDGKIFVTTLFPLTIFFLDRGFTKSFFKSLFNFSLLGLVLGVIIVSPHPQMSYFTLWIVSFYAAYKLFFMIKDGEGIAKAIRPAALTAYAVVIGLALSAIQFYPGYIYTSEFSPRADAKRGWDWATSWSMHEEEAASLLIPEFAGTSSQNTTTHYWGKNFFKDNSEAAGTVSFFLALIGFFYYRKRESYFFGGLAIFALLYALGATTPVFRLFFWLIPKVQSLRAPSMIMFVFSFCSAMLAGMAIQYFKDRAPKDDVPGSKLNYLLFGIPGLLGLAALIFSGAGKWALNTWTSLFYSEAPRMQVQQGITRLDLGYMNLPAISSGAWFAFLATAIVAALLWMYKSRKAGTIVLLVAIVIPIFNSGRFNSRFIETFDPSTMWGPNPVVDFIKQRPGHYRAENFDVLPADLLPYHGIECVTGYHGNQLRWYDELLGGPALTNQSNPRLLNLVGAKFLIFRSNLTIPPNYFGPKPVEPIMDLGSGKIFENDNAFERVFLVNRYQIITDRKEMVQQVLKGTIDMSQVALLEEEPALAISSDSLGADSCWLIKHDVDSVTVGLSCSQNRLLIMTDNYFDAWHASIDGKEVPIQRVDGSFRAVAVPAGSSEMLFWFESPRYATGKKITWISAIFLLIVVAGSGFLGYRKKEDEVSQ